MEITQVSEITEQAYASQEVPKQSRLTFATTMLKNPGTLKKFRVMDPDEERYVRPPREYEIPPFHEGMRYCTSKEPYVRATRWCNPREPLVVALAHELGAYELSDGEFAEAAYWWMKTNMWYAMTGFEGPSPTLKRGSGMCFHFTNTYIALCRCAGIKARYKSFQMKFRELEREIFTDVDPGFASVFDAAGGIIGEAEAELYIDGTWVTAYLAQPSCATDVDAIKLPERLDLCRSLLVNCLYRDPAASPHEFVSFFLRSFIRMRFSSDQQTSGTSHSVHAAVSLLKCSRTTTMKNAQPVWFDELNC